MVYISTYVFFDIETTGLPYQEKNRTKIIELCLVAITRKDIRRNKGEVPPISKLTLLFNPLMTIQSGAAAITGLNNEKLKYAQTFEEKSNTILSFLKDLKKPVCLVAHNGNTFDYKILLAECLDANVKLPEDLMCVDSLIGFRKLLKDKIIIDESILTDDEDDWPDLNITPEDLENIDKLCTSLHNMSCDDSEQNKKVGKAFNDKGRRKPRESYKLTDIYRRLMKREPENAHRAEDDCLMLLQCVGACQNPNNASEDFLYWIDDNCKALNEITPLQRK